MGNYSRQGSSNLVRPPESVQNHEHDINDLPVGRGPKKLALWEDLTDGFLAPNEFYVDDGHTPIDSRSRHVPTVAEALARADLLFAAGIDIVIRLREGQTHLYGDTTTLTRNVSFYSEGNPQGDLVGASAGVLDFSGAVFERPATTYEVAFKGLIFLGNPTFQEFHRVSFDSCTFRGVLFQAADSGAAGAFALNMVNCVADVSVNAARHPFAFEIDSGAGTTWTVDVDRCSFSAEITDARQVEFMVARQAAVTFSDCAFDFVNSDTLNVIAAFQSIAAAVGESPTITLQDCAISWSNTVAQRAIFGSSVGNDFDLAFSGSTSITCPDAVAFNLGLVDFVGTAAPDIHLTSTALSALPDVTGVTGNLPYGARIHTRSSNKYGPPYDFTFQPAVVGDPTVDLPFFGQNLPGQFLSGTTTNGAPSVALEPRYGAVQPNYDNNTAVLYRVRVIGSTLAGGVLTTSQWVIEGAAVVSGGVFIKVGTETKTVLADDINSGLTADANVVAAVSGVVVFVTQGATVTNVGWRAFVEQLIL